MKRNVLLPLRFQLFQTLCEIRNLKRSWLDVVKYIKYFRFLSGTSMGHWACWLMMDWLAEFWDVTLERQLWSSEIAVSPFLVVSRSFNFRLSVSSSALKKVICLYYILESVLKCLRFKYHWCSFLSFSVSSWACLIKTLAAVIEASPTSSTSFTWNVDSFPSFELIG